MKLCLAQTRPVPGDFAANIANHLSWTEVALAHGADLAVFPELSLTGYEPALARERATVPGDPRFDVFQKLADTGRISIGAGAPLRRDSGIAIGMVLFQPDRPRQVYLKKYIHADEEPFFVSGGDSPPLTEEKSGIALAICYELSVPEHLEAARQRGAEIYLASVVKTVPQVEKARERMAEIARTCSLVALMVNSVGESEGVRCGGRSAAWNEQGALLGQLGAAEEGLLFFDTATREVRAVS